MEAQEAGQKVQGDAQAKGHQHSWQDLARVFLGMNLSLP